MEKTEKMGSHRLCLWEIDEKMRNLWLSWETEFLWKTGLVRLESLDGRVVPKRWAHVSFGEWNEFTIEKEQFYPTNALEIPTNIDDFWQAIDCPVFLFLLTLSMGAWGTTALLFPDWGERWEGRGERRTRDQSFCSLWMTHLNRFPLLLSFRGGSEWNK